MVDSNVTKKPLLEKIQDLLERKQGNYDVAFCVGKEKKIVRAVKLLLKASSPFLEKEFEEKWEVAGMKTRDGILLIPLPDFEPIAVELFVKITFLDTWSLESLKELNLPLNQILNLLSICRRFEMKEAEENLKTLATITIFLQTLGEYKDIEDFLELSQMNLKSILASDEIGVRELDVLHAAMRWAKFHWKQILMNVEEPTDEQIREVLDDCLFEIGFAVMTRPEFTTASRKSLKFDAKMLQFKTTPRNKGQKLKSASWIPLPAAASPSETNWENHVDGFPPRDEHAAVAVDNEIYSFGGGGDSDDPSYSDDVLDVFALNVNKRKKKWKKLSIENGKVNPTQRRNHSAVAHKKCVLIFGGFDTKKRKYSNSTYRFNTQTLKWDKPEVTGNVAAPRLCHSAVVHRNEMLVYGGVGEGVTNVLHSLNLKSFCWSTIKTKGIPPSVRAGHSATVHNDRFILIFGGYDFTEYKRVNTILSFDVNHKTWTAVETRGTSPPGRSHHCAFVHDGRMYIFGGFDKHADNLNDVFSYDPDPETSEWKKMTPNGQAPSPRRHAGCVALDDQVFVFGGWNRYEWYLTDTFVLQM